MSRIHAHRLIEGAKVTEMLPIGNKPATESQARPLTKNMNKTIKGGGAVES